MLKEQDEKNRTQEPELPETSAAAPNRFSQVEQSEPEPPTESPDVEILQSAPWGEPAELHRVTLRY